MVLAVEEDIPMAVGVEAKEEEEDPTRMDAVDITTRPDTTTKGTTTTTMVEEEVVVGEVVVATLTTVMVPPPKVLLTLQALGWLRDRRRKRVGDANVWCFFNFSLSLPLPLPLPLPPSLSLSLSLDIWSSLNSPSNILLFL